ncbi:hypothetical protein KP509_16G029100 [Ceratopteris richardii]|uniref:Glycosyltransferase n=1 Tax=Ceratopteris richardii TaxID=49495 RepID=A0A8T2SZK8_CERRI|nr:hypothetical protein KP509_16G029100 [Ceratopteris richardii]
MASDKKEMGVDDVSERSVWILPFAQQGHINPLMQLAKVLGSRGQKVTFLLQQNSFQSQAALEVPGVSILGVDDQLPPERSRGSSFRDSVDSMHNMEAPFSSLITKFHHRVSFLIYDAFMSWAPSIASSFDIPSSCFFTSNATACTLGYNVPFLLERGILPFRPDEGTPLPTTKVQGVNGIPDLLPEDYPLCLTFDASHFRYQFMVQIGKTLHGASSIILNTVEELEPEPIAALRAHIPVLALGPLLALSGRPSRLAVNYWTEDDRCLPWLDSQAPGTVLFVSFGSVASLSLLQFQELAMGLEASGQPFLWVVRPDSIDVPLLQALPDGFQDRTKDRGLIITWGPQILILSHPAVGGFLTHGGWNSLIENISTGSVPVICWPHVAEQRLNRFMVSEIWKIGLCLQHNEDGGVSKGEISRVIQDMFHGNKVADLKHASKLVGEHATRAVVEGGSSYRNLEELQHFLCT